MPGLGCHFIVAQVDVAVSQAVLAYASGSPPHVFQPEGGAARVIAGAKIKKKVERSIVPERSGKHNSKFGLQQQQQQQQQHNHHLCSAEMSAFLFSPLPLPFSLTALSPSLTAKPGQSKCFDRLWIEFFGRDLGRRGIPGA